MASHLLNTIGAIALWLSIGCCLLIAAYLLCWFLGREAQRPGMADYPENLCGDWPRNPFDRGE